MASYKPYKDFEDVHMYIAYCKELTISVNLRGANLCGANLCGADLRNANLCNANLRDANLRDANLYDANLYGADLRSANLYNANLRSANLRDANLSDANLRGANLYNANLRSANLRDANLFNANLRSANLRDANLSDANLWDADLSDANLWDANLRSANLRSANLSDANLRGADLLDAKYSCITAFFALACPEEGSFVAWKKVNGYIIKLKVPEYAKRSSATTRKCRCSGAYVLEIQNIDGGSAGIGEVTNTAYNQEVVYKVGSFVTPDGFDDDRWNECAKGIHFFITRQEAVQY